MTLEEKVGQMLMLDFRQWNGKNVTESSPEIAAVIKKYHPGGVILFKENVVSTEQTVNLVQQLQAASDVPLLMAIDQEGGSIVRLQSGTTMPGNMALGATRSTDDAYQVGKAIGEELKALGINFNLAPVMDVNLNPDNPVIGVRSFGSDPQLVGDLGVAYINGLHAAGVAGCVKHFPGHGDTSTDSHLGLPSVPHDKFRLKAVELQPFQEAMDNGTDAVMTAHITFPAIDNTQVVSKKDGQQIYVPATLSEKVLTGLIRKDMGFKGVVVTDAMKGMKAITENFGAADAAVGAVKAGTDIVLMPEDVDQAYNAILQAVKTGEISEERINQSVMRILTLKIERRIAIIKDSHLVSGSSVSEQARLAQARASVGSKTHLALEKTVAERAVTLVKNKSETLPFLLKKGCKVVILAPYDDRLKPMVDATREIIKTRKLTGIDVKGFAYTNMKTPSDEQQQAIQAADYVIIGSYSGDVASRSPGKNWIPDYVSAAVSLTNTMNKPAAVLAIRNPYDIMYLPQANAFLCVYGKSTGPNIPAGMRAIFGDINPTGKLPVFIPSNDGKNVLYPVGYGLSYPSTVPELYKLQNDVQTRLNQINGKLEKAARQIDKVGLNSAEARNVLKKLETNIPGVVDYCTIDLKGKMVVVEPPAYHEYEGSDISQQDQVKRIQKTAQPVLSWAFMAVEGFVSADLEQPVFDSNKRFKGAISVLLKPGDYFKPFAAANPEDELMVVQKDGYILFDTDSTQIGKNTFKDPAYQRYPNLLALCSQVTANRFGSGTYEFQNQADKQVVKKRAYWTTVGLHGTEWRLVLIKKDPAVNNGLASSIISTTAERETVYQVSTINALLDGFYDGVETVGELKKHGNLGTGTFHRLDGEMTALDGQVYQIKADGSVNQVADNITVPFASVTCLEADKDLTLKDVADFKALQAVMDKTIDNSNVFYAFRIDGTFDYVKTRSVPAQNKPYPPLAEVTKNQPTFEFKGVKGSIVGFWCPAYVNGINIPGYHLHFVTEDRTGGGHLLECSIKEARLQADRTAQFHLVLPENSDFGKIDLARDRSQETELVEKAH